MKLQRISAIARKEAIQTLRDWPSLLIVLIMPLMLMIVLGYGIRLDLSHVPTCVYDREGSQKSQALLKRFQASEYFSIVRVNRDYRDLVGSIDNRICKFAVVLPEHFSKRLDAGAQVDVQGIVDASDDNSANLIFNYAEGVLSGYSDEQQLHFLRQVGISRMTRIAVDAHTWFNEDLKSSNFIVPGVVVVVMAVIGTFLTALTVAREWERGTMEQLISTPVTAAEIALGKLLPYFLIGLFDTAICGMIGALWFRAPMRGAISLMCLASFLFLNVVLLTGFLISALTKNQNVASQLSLLFTFLPAFLLSGFIAPLEQTPVGVRALSIFIPARYYTELLRGICMKGLGATELLPQFAALAAFGALLWIATVWSFRKDLN